MNFNLDLPEALAGRIAYLVDTKVISEDEALQTIQKMIALRPLKWRQPMPGQFVYSRKPEILQPGDYGIIQTDPETFEAVLYESGDQTRSLGRDSSLDNLKRRVEKHAKLVLITRAFAKF